MTESAEARFNSIKGTIKTADAECLPMLTHVSIP